MDFVKVHPLVLVNLDDLLVATESVEKNIAILQEVFSIMVKNVLALMLQNRIFRQYYR